MKVLTLLFDYTLIETQGVISSSEWKWPVEQEINLKDEKFCNINCYCCCWSHSTVWRRRRSGCIRTRGLKYCSFHLNRLVVATAQRRAVQPDHSAGGGRRAAVTSQPNTERQQRLQWLKSAGGEKSNSKAKQQAERTKPSPHHMSARPRSVHQRGCGC